MTQQATKQAEKKEEARMIDIYIMGKHYQVPEGLTIMTALEYCGYRMIRGCGCRAAFCGACATVYNFKNDPTLRYALACAKLVEPEMYLTQIPFFPASKPEYKIDDLTPTAESILKVYPQLITCFGCNNCTKACPQELEVMACQSAALRGDIREVANKSFDCILCGMCAARCPQGLVPYNVSLLCRRLYGRHIAKKDQRLQKVVETIASGKYDKELEEMEKADIADLTKRYDTRQIIDE